MPYPHFTPRAPQLMWVPRSVNTQILLVLLLAWGILRESVRTGRLIQQCVGLFGNANLSLPMLKNQSVTQDFLALPFR